MLKKVLSFLGGVSLLCTSATAAATITPEQPEYKNGCYQISNAAELYGFAAIVNGDINFPYDATACGKLTKDIVVNQNVLKSDGSLNAADTANFAKWTPIGPFYGTFDGQNHTVSGLYFSSETGTDAGFFKSLHTAENQYVNTVVKNVGVVGSYFRAGYSAGGIAGSAYSRTSSVVIENCFNASRVEAVRNNAGGIVGTTSNYATVRIGLYNVYNTGTVVGLNNIGGVIGYQAANGIAVINAYNAGEIIGTGNTNSIKSVFGGFTKDDANVIENVFYLEPGRNEHAGRSVTEAELKSGIITQVMRHYDLDGISGTKWGQKVGTDPLPNFSGSLTGASFKTIKMNVYHGSTKLKTKDMVVGYSYRIPNVAVEGYDFFGWYANSGLTGDTVVHTPASLTEDVDYWGRYEKKYKVSFVTNSGTIDSGLVEQYTHSVGVVLPKKVSRRGYVFVGWYANEDLSGDRVVAIGKEDSGDKTFYAKWYKLQTPPINKDTCYVISNAAELYGFAAIVNGADGFVKEEYACAVLEKDIVVNQGVLDKNGMLNTDRAGRFVPWVPIDSFYGEFDGMGHTISGLYYDDSTSRNNFGLFGSVAGYPLKYAVLKNFGLVDSYFKAKANYMGAIVGQTANAQLGNSDAQPASYVKISGVYNESTVETYSSAQGIAGIVGSVGYKGILDMENVYNLGLALGSNYNIGGIIAHFMSNTNVTVKNCYSVWKDKSKMGSSKALFGGSLSSTKYTFDNCYYLNTQRNNELAGLPATAEQFRNGSVAEVLRDGENGSVWGQNVGMDAYPNLSGELKNSLAQRYAVTFHTFEGDTAEYFGSYVSGFKKILPTVVKENTTFMGWYDNAQYEGNVVTQIDSAAKGDKEFWAKLQRTFAVTLNTNGGTISSGAFDTYTEGVGAKLPRTVLRDTNVFAGWYENEDLSGTPVAEITPADSGDKTYYAAWLKLKMPELDSEDNCYVITDVAELYGYVAYMSGRHRMYYNIAYENVCGKLANDIVVNENVLKEDGTLDSANVVKFLPWESIRNFGASFDGQGHKISGLYMSEPDSNYVGFIARITTAYDASWNIVPATIKNLTIEDSYIAGLSNVGGFVAYNNKSLSIENCHFKGMVIALPPPKSLTSYVGGFVGMSSGNTATTTIKDSDVGGYIESRSNAGGLVGYLHGTNSITNCSNSATIFGGFSSAGGLAGYASGTTVIMNSSNHGDVSNLNTGENIGYCAGLVARGETNFTLLQSYNEGTIGGPSSYVAGLVADVYGNSGDNVLIANNYNVGKVYSEREGKFTYVSGLVTRINGRDVKVKLINNYSIAELSKASVKGNADYVVADSGYNPYITAENNFVLGTVDTLETTPFGTVAEAGEFKDGTVADALHDYVQKDGEGVVIENGINGTVWAQGDKYPILVTKSEFAIVFNANGGKLENPPTTYTYGEGLMLPVPTRVGHSFHGWYTSAAFQGDSIAFITPKDAGDKIFYAKWEANQYHVTAKVNNTKWGIVDGLNKSGIYSYGSEVRVTAVPDNGYKFSYWEDDVRNTSASRHLTVVSDTTITAHFDPINPESSSSVTSSSSVNPPKSSSSSAKSSSSVKSSSSSAKSSSSVKTSSSSAKSSSSKAKSSSSKGKSSSSKQSLVAQAAVPQFSVEVLGRNVQVAGARVGSAYAVLDMQGRVLSRGRVDSANFNLPMASSGTFLIQVGGQSVVARVR